MEQKKDKSASIFFGNDQSAETLFQKINSLEITSQVEVAVSFDNPKRKELFERIIESTNNETLRQNISLIVKRIEQAAFQIAGYTASETEYYQGLFAKHFYSVLHSENYQTYIEDKIRELHFYCKGLEQDLRTKQHEFIEDREQDKNQLTEAQRYKCYLENLLIHLNNPAAQQTGKPKPEQETPQTFDELFYNIELVQPSIDILKEIEPPLIDTDYNYIGRLKGIICVWINELQKQGIVKSNYPEERKLFAALIPQKIKRFSIDESMFGKYQSKAENNYRADIKTKVSKIKLSQNSH